MMPSNHFILCHPLLLPSIFPHIRALSNELALCIRWPKYWSFSFSISPSNDYSGLISFRIDWFDLLAVQGTLLSSTTVQRHLFFGAQPFLSSSFFYHHRYSVNYLRTFLGFERMQAFLLNSPKPWLSLIQLLLHSKIQINKKELKS